MFRKSFYTATLSAAALSATLFSTSAVAACKIERFDQLGDQLESVQAALSLAHQRIGAESIEDDTEYVGVIWKNADGFAITAGRGCEGGDSFEFRLRPKAGYQVAALWHTHGAPGPFRKMFSPEDGHFVRHTGLPSYLLTASGAVKILHPETLPSRPKWLRLPGSRTSRMQGYEGSWLNSVALAINR